MRIHPVLLTLALAGLPALAGDPADEYPDAGIYGVEAEAVQAPPAPADTLSAPETVRPAPRDSLSSLGDTLSSSADTLSSSADTLSSSADTLSAARDSLPPDSAAAARPGKGLQGRPAPIDSAEDGAVELDEKSVKNRGTSTHRQKEVSRIRLGREQLQKVAAAQGDPFKVLGTLPGVTNQNDMSVRPFVRGGKAEETQVLWEGIPLLQPYHFASVYSIFNMEGLEDMTLYSGGFPASVGNALSGAIFMRSRPAPLDSFRLFADLSILRGLGHVGIPLVKNRLGAAYSFQSFWYDQAVDRGWDLLDLLAGDSVISDAKEKYRQYLDMPNFTDHQFGLNWRRNDALSARYTGIVSRDVFTVRETRNRYYVNGKEVSPDYWDYHLFYGPPADRRQRLGSWDSLAIVRVDNSVHGVNFEWKPADRWQVDQAVAWQSQDWHVGFYDQEIWTDSVTPDGRFAGGRRPGPSSYLFTLANQALDYRLDARYAGEAHNLSAGLSQTFRSHRYHTELPKPVYDVIVNGSVDALDALGFLNPEGILIRRSDPGVDPSMNFLKDLPELIRFDHRGRQSGNFLGVYASDGWNLDPRHRLTLGLRAETDSYGGGLFLSPRLAWFQALGDKDELTLASGLYSQGDFPFFARSANPDLRSEKAFHANLEWTHAFSKSYRLECQAYQKNYYDLVIADVVNTGELDWDSELLNSVDSAMYDSLNVFQKRAFIELFGERRLNYVNGGQGKASGIEVSFFFDPNRVWSGWVSGEVGYSRRLERAGERIYDFRQSRPWAFNWVNYFHMPSNYEMSIRARFASGLPFTDYSFAGFGEISQGGGIDDVDPVSASSDTLFHVGPRNAARYTPYSRWDLRLAKEFRIRKHPLQSYFEIWNAFNTPNFIMADSRTGKWKFFDLNYPVPIVFLGLNFRW